MTSFGGSSNSFPKMSTFNVKSILLVNSSNRSCSYSILFHCARFWAQQGSRVLFISKTPLKNLPFTIGKTDVFVNPDAVKLIQFMYLADWRELIQQLYSIHLRHDPISVIIVKNLENYFKSDSQPYNSEELASLVCASLLYAMSACAKVVSQPVFLLNEYVSQDSSIEKIVVKTFFQNIWGLKRNTNEKGKTYELTKLSVSVNGEIVNYTFCESLTESRLTFEEVIKLLVSIC